MKSLFGIIIMSLLGFNLSQSNLDYNNIILMGGLDYRDGDLSITEQSNLLKLSSGKNVIGYRYNEFSKVKESILKHPNSYIVLFSAGCSYSSEVSDLIYDKTKLFIVEPYGNSINTVTSVQRAVSKGVPSINVITGPVKERGAGIVVGSTKTPVKKSHWAALNFVGNLINKL